MCFTEYRKKHNRWLNPFQSLDAPQLNSVPRDFMPEDEFLKFFYPGVLRDTMELAVCACMFLSGLRRGEIAALKPECLDWVTPKITVKYNWQRYNKKSRVLSTTKSKKQRDAPFDPVLQAVITLAPQGMSAVLRSGVSSDFSPRRRKLSFPSIGRTFPLSWPAVSPFASGRL
jgi:integrase